MQTFGSLTTRSGTLQRLAWLCSFVHPFIQEIFAEHLVCATPGMGRSPGGGHGNPFQYSCRGKSHGPRSLAGYSPWGCKESDMTEAT